MLALDSAFFFWATSNKGLPSRERITFQCTLLHQPLASRRSTDWSKAYTVTMPPFSKNVVRW